MHRAYVWIEPLPENCPPADATPPDNARFFRLVNSIPPMEGDFASQRAMHPEKRFSQPECTARACSLFGDHIHCLKIAKLPTHRGQKVVEITLLPESGLVKETSGPGHFSWWRAQGYDLISHCREAMLSEVQ